MSQTHSGAATLPKGFRYHDDCVSAPKTPEPDATAQETRLPSPPRQRFRLKRRHVSQLAAPTQQFLASVAAADVPIQSIESSDPVNPVDYEMADSLPQVQVHHCDDNDHTDPVADISNAANMDIYQHIQVRKFSPPRTPALDFPPALPATKYPNWSIDSAWSSSDLESSPDDESSRPSTAFSTQTSTSLFSQFSYASDEEECVSPEAEVADPIKTDAATSSTALPKNKSRKAPWTPAMSTHLWSTYTLYLQDPRVTPVRLGQSCIPPHGVCLRVARQAKRSWKGAKAKGLATEQRSRSSTPTAESAKPFIQWPHTGAATRAHLRELCKTKAAEKAGRIPRMSRSPTPFNKGAHRRWNRRSASARTPCVFSGNDMQKSLTLCTSDAMQPQGPLAQLTSSFPEPPSGTLPPFNFQEATVPRTLPDDDIGSSCVRLGSPFTANSYGPSSSAALAPSVHIPRQSQTMEPRKLLQSPARLTRSRSGTTKRKPPSAFEYMARKRPSLAAAFGTELTYSKDPEPRRHSVGNLEDPFMSRDVPGSKSRGPGSDDNDPFVLSSSSAATTSRRARLGSPFSGHGSSHSFSGHSSSQSFPNRLSGPINFAALQRPFATVQQASEPSEESQPGRPSLASRLAYLDQRLRDFRSRGSERSRRSQSPL